MHLSPQHLKKKLKVKTNACKKPREQKERVGLCRFESPHIQFLDKKKASVYKPEVIHSQIDLY